MNLPGCTEKVSEACTHKSFEIIQTVEINQSNSSLIPATTKRQNNWIESCAAYAEFCRSHILPMMNQNKLCHHKGISDREKINLNRINITRSYGGQFLCHFQETTFGVIIGQKGSRAKIKQKCRYNVKYLKNNGEKLQPPPPKAGRTRSRRRTRFSEILFYKNLQNVV